MSEQYLIDVPVAIFFFNRPDTLKKVFEAVKKARPSRLFLIQDGPRENNAKDALKIKECRKVVSNIDWKCEVTRLYSEMNLGCGRRMYTGITSAFESVDRLIILEDDCVPNLSMFNFCAEILEKYKDDTRINMISGMNHLETANFGGDSYCFCKTGAIWGWATWKRVWDLYEYSMEFSDDSYVMQKFSELRMPRHYIKRMKSTELERKKSIQAGKPLTAWTYQFAMIRHLYSQLVIVPKYNLITNIGLTDETTHGSSSIKLIPKGLQRVFFMPTHEIDFPLVHPKYIIENTEYDKNLWRIMGETVPIKYWRRIEGIIRRIVFKRDIKNMINRVKKH